MILQEVHWSIKIIPTFMKEKLSEYIYLFRKGSQKRDEDPAYYDSFPKRIKEALKLYKEKMI